MAEAKSGAFENTTQGKDHFPTEDDAPVIQLQDTDFGFQYAAIRHSDDGNEDSRYVRVTPYVMPYMTYVPPGSPAAMFIPIDDENCAMIQVIWDVEDSPDRSETFRLLGLDDPEIWNPEDRWLNLLPQDRQAMKEGRSWTGLYGLVSQDAAMTLSMGGIFDRSHEHVVPADMAVVRLRRLLIKAAKTLADGTEPVGLDRPISTEKISGAAGIVTAGSSWSDLVPGNVPL
jgi:phthalate 4,5-dioxygenase oxygenase subunit